MRLFTAWAPVNADETRRGLRAAWNCCLRSWGVGAGGTTVAAVEVDDAEVEDEMGGEGA